MKISAEVSYRLRAVTGLLAVATWVVLAAGPAGAQQHRAVRLGNPSTRFAPPLANPEQLRTLLTEEKTRADVASILQQAGWKGNVDDLRRAAATATITEVKLPKGTRLPYMSARKDGKPVALIDVLWDGEEPIEAYVFEFASNGRRYRCVTPKPCSNFLTIDLGPDQPALQLIKSAPAEAGLCEPIPMKITVRNICTLPLTRVLVADTLPAGLKMADGRTTLNLDAGDLKPGTGKEFTFNVVASAPGGFVNTVHAAAAEGGAIEATATTLVRAPVLAIECNAPAEVIIGRPAEICFTVKNTGDAVEAKATLALLISAGATLSSATEGGVVSDGRVVWEMANLASQASKRVCVVVQSRQPGSLDFAPAVRGLCAQPVEAKCATRVAGVPAILIEVVDLADPIEVNQPVTYEIRVTNQGSATLTNIRLVCTVPDLQEFVSGGGVTEVHADGRTVTMESLPTLASKATATWRVVTKAAKEGDARFKVKLTSDQFQRSIGEDESTTQY